MRRTYLLESPLRRPRLVWVPTLAFALAAAVAAYFVPPRYRAEALVGVAANAADDAALRAGGVDPEARRLQELTRRVTHPELLRRVAQSDPSSLRVRPMASSSYWIEFTHSDARTAALVPNTIAQLLADESRPAAAASAAPALGARLEQARLLLQEKQAALEPSVPRRTDAKAVAELLEIDDAIAEARARAARLRIAGQPATPPPPPAQRELEALRAQLDELRKRYKDEHPDVERLRARIARAELALPAATPVEPAPTPPASELAAVESEIEALLARKAELQARANRSARSATSTAAPETDRERTRRLLELQEAQQAYDLLLAESRAPETPAAPPERGPVASLELLRPAAVPTAPLSPPLPLVVLAGAALGLLFGLLLAVVVELRDHSVKGPEDLATILPVPLLTTVPEMRGRSRGRRA